MRIVRSDLTNQHLRVRHYGPKSLLSYSKDQNLNVVSDNNVPRVKAKLHWSTNWLSIWSNLLVESDIIEVSGVGPRSVCIGRFRSNTIVEDDIHVLSWVVDDVSCLG